MGSYYLADLLCHDAVPRPANPHVSMLSAGMYSYHMTALLTGVIV